MTGTTSYALTARRRQAVGKAVAALRLTKTVPGVLYGHGVKNENLEVSSLDLQKIFRQAGSSTLVDLMIDEAAPIKVLINAIQRHPLRQSIVHVDFYQVRMTEKLETDIELEIIGESPAVKEQGGILVRSLDKVKVECLPGDLASSITVDISSLKTFEDRIHVRDLPVPSGITIMDQPDEVVASVTPPRSDDELEALKGAVEIDVTAVGSAVEKPKKDEESADDDTAAQPEAKT